MTWAAMDTTQNCPTLSRYSEEYLRRILQSDLSGRVRQNPVDAFSRHSIGARNSEEDTHVTLRDRKSITTENVVEPKFPAIISLRPSGEINCRHCCERWPRAQHLSVLQVCESL